MEGGENRQGRGEIHHEAAHFSYLHTAGVISSSTNTLCVSICQARSFLAHGSQLYVIAGPDPSEILIPLRSTSNHVPLPADTHRLMSRIRPEHL